MKEKNNGLIVLVVILSVLVIVLGGFICYDKLIKNDREVVDVKNTKKENTLDEKTDSKQQELSENSYQLYSENMKKERKNKYDLNNSNYQYVESNLVKDGYIVSLESDGNLYVTYSNEELYNKYGKYNISSNVLSFYIIHTGQNDGNSLYFIKEDGSVSQANTEYNINDGITIKNNVGNYKNIVSVLEGSFSDGHTGTYGPIFVDINGNIYSENLN